MREAERKGQRSPFPRPLARPTLPQRPSLPTWRGPLAAGFQLLGQAGHLKGAGPAGPQAVVSLGVGAWQALETEGM